jgi:hypothetical protein
MGAGGPVDDVDRIVREAQDAIRPRPLRLPRGRVAVSALGTLGAHKF